MGIKRHASKGRTKRRPQCFGKIYSGKSNVCFMKCKISEECKTRMAGENMKDSVTEKVVEGTMHRRVHHTSSVDMTLCWQFKNHDPKSKVCKKCWQETACEEGRKSLELRDVAEKKERVTPEALAQANAQWIKLESENRELREKNHVMRNQLSITVYRLRDLVEALKTNHRAIKSDMNPIAVNTFFGSTPSRLVAGPMLKQLVDGIDQDRQCIKNAEEEIERIGKVI